MFLLNSRLTRFSAAGFCSQRKATHILPAPLIPKLRGHFAEFLLRKSLEHLRLLASPTCVGFAVRSMTDLVCEAFLGSMRHPPFAGSEDPFGIGSRLPGRICLPRTAYHLASDNPPPDGRLAPASLLRLEQPDIGTGILTRFPSATPFGLTLGAD